MTKRAGFGLYGRVKVPLSLSRAFGAEFQALLASFAVEEGLLADPSELESVRFLARSVAPHISKLSSLFNREDKDQASALAPYLEGKLKSGQLALGLPALFHAGQPLPDRGGLGGAGSARVSLESRGRPARNRVRSRPRERIERDRGRGTRGAGGPPLDRQLRADRAGSPHARVGARTGSNATPGGPRPQTKETPREPLGGRRVPFTAKSTWAGRCFPRSAPVFNLWLSSFFWNEFPPTRLGNSGGADRGVGTPSR